MELNERDAVIVAYGRTAYAKAKKGSFCDVHPVEYGGQCLQRVLEKVPQLDPLDIDDVIVGTSIQLGVNSYNIGRMIAQRAGLPDEVPGQTVTRFCASGLQTIATAANAIMCGQEEVIAAGGCESMSQVSMAVDLSVADPWLLENRPGLYDSMGETAEKVAEQFGITLEEMNQMCVESHAKAAKAQHEGWLADQIVPVVVEKENGETVTVTKDEGIREGTSMETLATLTPCFRPDGVVTAATSSQMTDGAGFVVIMSAAKARELGVKPIARFVSFAAAGVDPSIMGIGPTAAVPKVMKKSGMNLEDMDVIEINEAFASQAIYCIRELGMDKEKVNPYGGAMALGHPLGASGAMLVVKALDYLQRFGGRYALITMCVGAGQGAAGIFEMVD